MATQIIPYFYFLSPTPFEDESIRSKLIQHKKFDKLLDVTVDHRKLLARDQVVLKITCSDPGVVSTYAKEMRRVLGAGQGFEDLRLPVRYLTDCGLTTCGWNECEVEEVAVENVIVDRTYAAASLPESLPNGQPPKLRALAFSILTVAEKGSAKPETDPVQAIGIATDSGRSELLQTSEANDLATMKAFAEHVKKYDPDILVGFDSNRTYWPYLIQRSNRVGERLPMGRDGSEPHSSVFGHVSITGRANLDLSDLASGIPEVKVKTIENTARFFQLPVADKIGTVDEWDRHEIWLKGEGRERLLENTRLMARACSDLESAAIDYPMQLSAITGLPLDEVMAAAVGFRVDSYFVRHAHQMGELVPIKNEQPYLTFQGATVLEPETGVHENVAVLDFASMYPRLMMKYNLSPDTLVKSDERVSDELVYVMPEVEHRFRKEPDGFYRIVLTSLIREREAIRKEIENQTLSSTMFQVLRERDRAVKIITNACYGYAGWAGARWYSREVAESATALGRETIRKTIEKAKSLGLKIIYGDTDSIFVTNDKSKVDQLLEWVKRELELDIRIEQEYTRVLFTEAMKRYAGLRADGGLDIVGLEVVRSDWSNIARRVQEGVLEHVLRDQSTEKAVRDVRKTIGSLRNGEVPITDLILRKALTKPIEKYAIRAPHVEVARQMMKEGWEMTVGDKVPYVIAKGSGSLYKRARPPYGVMRDDVDFEYYVENQVKPVAMRILERFGVDERRLLA
jgi:DNA polymerase I